MKPFRSILLIMLMLVISLASVPIAQAASKADLFDATIDFDSTSSIDYTIISGTIGSGETGQGINSDDHVGPPGMSGYYYWDSFLILIIPSGTLTNISFDFWQDNTASSTSIAFMGVVWDASEAPADDYDLLHNCLSALECHGTTSGTLTHNTWDTFDEVYNIDCASQCKVVIWVGQYSAGDTVTWDTKIDNIVVTVDDDDDPWGGGPSDEPYQPIRTAYQFDVFTGMDESDNIISDSSIVATGTCLSSSTCVAPFVYAAFTGEVTRVFSEPDGTYDVTIVGDIDGVAHEAHYSNLVNVLVQPGDTITGGCVLGRAGPEIRFVDASSLSPSERTLFEIHYYLINTDLPGPVEGLANYQDWTDDTDPSGSTPCSSRLFNPNCLNTNANFAFNGEGWYGLPNDVGQMPTFHEGNVDVPPGSSIAQDIEIADPDTYIVTVGFAPTTDSQVRVVVSLGGDDADVVSTYGSVAGEITIQQTEVITPTAPDTEPDIYVLKLTARKSTRITFVCMQPEGGASSPPLTGCYFSDSDFATGDGWTLSGGAELGTDTLAGFTVQHYVSLPETDSVTQEITLYGYDDGPGNYTVKVTAYVIPFSFLPASNHGTLLVTFDASDDDFDQGQTFTINPSMVVGTFEQEWSIPTGESATGDFIVEDAALVGDAEAIKVTSVCITPERGYWYDPTGTNPTVVSETEQVCSQVINIVNETPTEIVGVGKWIVSWLGWVGKYLGIAIDCNIRRAVDAVTAFLKPLFDWLGMVGRWIYATSSRIGAWILSIIAYVLRLLGNLINQAINAVWAAIVATNILRTLFDGVDSVGQIIDTLIALVLSIAGLITRIINVLATLAQIVGTFWTALVAAFNSTTTTDIGMPVCGSITEIDPLFGLCQGLELFEYVIEVFPALNALGIVVIAAIAMWVAKETIEKTGNAFGETA